ncbi:MAG: choice-of-anchor D domain-containing protein [Saprospiraceae bacterium]|nr:choice-of-anchor D domain-containing protein [Saprospiraceae bacterium]
MKVCLILNNKVGFLILGLTFLNLFFQDAKAQTTLLSESFETDGEGIRYNSSHYILCTGPNQQDFFFRTNITPANPNMPPDCTIGHGTAITNIQGSYYWASEDIMSSPGILPPGDMTFVPFNICGYSNLEASLYLACSNNNNVRWEAADSINIKVSIDGGPFRTVGRFFGGLPFGGNLLIDANLNGVVDPSESTPICDISTLTKYTFPIPYSGASLQLKLDFDQVGGTEELAFDLVEVKGVSAGLPEINVQGGSPLANIVDGDLTTSLTNHTSFGTVNVGNNLVRTYTIQNTGPSSLIVTSIAKSGPDQALFTIGNLSPASPIPSMSTANFTVTFAPTSVGMKNATITITNSDCNEGNYDFAISGTGASACSLSAAITGNTPVSCNGGSNGSLTVTASNGVTNYSYVWSNGNNTTGTASVTNVLSGLLAGTYAVTVTDGNACTATASATVTQPMAITATTSQNNISCFGGNNGSINLSVSGGTGAYTYDWDNDGAEMVDNDLQDLSGLSAGTYTVTVTDANGCTKTASATITQPTDILTSTMQVNSSCFGGNNGSINLSVSGGTGAYTYDWDNDGAEMVDNDLQDLSGLSAGTYTVTVTDANGCTKTASATITQPTDILTSTMQVNSSCFGGSNGSINLSVSGGTGAYTYDWDNDGAEMVDNDLQDLSGLSAGTYTVTVTDANGCTKTASATITQPTDILTSTMQVNSSCFGGNNGSINLSVSGGTGAYSYDWDNDGAEMVDNDLQDLSGLSAGTYTVTVTDANGCTKTASATITQPTDILTSTMQVNSSCFGGSNGSINLSVSGGTGAYTYDWDNDGAEMVDNDLQDLSGLSAGTYTVTVTDANGCTKTASATITQPGVILASTTQINVGCYGGNNGSIDLTVSGGAGSYTYDWDDDGAEMVDDDLQDLSGLSAGTYTVTVTDVNGCTQTASAIVTEPANSSNYQFIGPGTDFSNPLNWQNGCVPPNNINTVTVTIISGETMVLTNNFDGTIINFGTLKGANVVIGNLINNGILQPGN